MSAFVYVFVTEEGIKWNYAMYALNHSSGCKLLKQGNPIKSRVSSRKTLFENKADKNTENTQRPDRGGSSDLRGAVLGQAKFSSLSKLPGASCCLLHPRYGM